MNIPITQSNAWQDLQTDLGEVTYRGKGNGYQYLAIYNETPVANYLYLPYGPIITDKTGFKNFQKIIANLIKDKNLAFIRIEPQNKDIIKLFPKNYQKTTDLNPKETWILDLKGESIKEKLPSRLLRYYKSAEKNGLIIKTSKNPEDIKILTSLQNAFAKERGINTFSEKYLKTELAQSFSTLYYIEYENPETKNKEIVAAGLVFDDKNTRYNIQGAQNEQGRKLHATGILTIQLILDAKEKGLKIFDFWGIAPENAPKTHPWAGFTNFKKTFKGEEVNYAGTYDIVLKPARYKIYKLFRKINRLIRR